MSPDIAERLVDAINSLYGRHPGSRAAHAKGTLLAGMFTPTGAASHLTPAAHLQSTPIRTTVRFSNGGGDPTAPDGTRDGRGMSVKFYLPDASTTDIVAITLPTFFVRTPEDLIAFNEARTPDPETGQPDMEKLGAFLGAHPEAQAAIQFAVAMQPPASYAQLRYFAIHAFRFVGREGQERFVRYRWEPRAGEAFFTDEEAASRSPDYLQEEILQRVAGDPVSFDLWLAIGEDGDPTDDPTAAWPEDRETVNAGRLDITGPETERERDGDILVFDPTRVTEGIELSGDRVLAARRDAYSVSVARRTG